MNVVNKIKNSLIWVVTTICISYFLFNNGYREPTEYFSVCIEHGNEMRSIYLQDYKVNVHKLCSRQRHVKQEGISYLDIELISTENNAQIWRMEKVTGGPSDPAVYIYKIKGKSVEPLREAHAGYIFLFISSILAFISIFFCHLFFRIHKTKINTE